MIFPQPEKQTAEHWVRFKAPGPAEGTNPAGDDVAVVSGYASYQNLLVTGSDESDETAVDHECHLFVGPRWRTVNGVSPTVTISGNSHFSSDGADATGWRVEDCKWDFPLPPPADGAKIKLTVFLHARGGTNFSVTGLAYHLTARGVLAPDVANNEGFLKK